MKRRWLQFRLRTLFGLLTLAAAVTGVVQHVWYVRERIQFHQAKAATCEERLVRRIDTKLIVLRLLRSTSVLEQDFPEEVESVQIKESPLPEGHLLLIPRGPRIRVRISTVPNTVVEWDRLTHVIREREQAVARIQDAQLYHQEQVEQYRHALWRPWLRVAENHSRELLDEQPEMVSPFAAPETPSIPSLPIRTQEVPPIALPELEAPRVVRDVPEKVKLPWNPIDRPLPRDFDERDVRVERAVKA